MRNALLILRQINDLHARVAEGAVALTPMVLGGDSNIVVLIIIVDDLRVRALLLLHFVLDGGLSCFHPADDFARLFGSQILRVALLERSWWSW